MIDLNFYNPTSKSNNDSDNLFSSTARTVADTKQALDNSFLNYKIDPMEGAYSNFASQPLVSGLTSNSLSTKSSPSWWDSFFGYRDNSNMQHIGWGSTALDVLKSGLGFYYGNKQTEQAEKALAENRRQFDLNFNAQKALINDQLAWQTKARNDRMGSNYEALRLT